MTPAPLMSGRVLVSGHRGYIGPVLVRRLLAAGWEVEGLDSGLYEGCDLAAAGPLPAIAWHRADIREVEPDDLAGYDAVIHLAALSNDPLGDLDPRITDEVNHLATARLAKAARRGGVRRFLFASSCSNYGASGDALLDEDAPLRPVTPYGRSKVAAEAALATLADSSFRVTSLRLATAYGLSPRLRFDLVINNLAAWALGAGLVRLKSDGTPWRPVVHVEDIAAAFLAALQAPAAEAPAEVLNVVPPHENHRVATLAGLVVAAVPGARLCYAEGAGPDLRNYRVSGERIGRRLPSWQPQWTAARGIAELVERLTSNPPPPDLFEGPAFQRLAHLRRLLDQGRLDASLRFSEADSAAA